MYRLLVRYASNSLALCELAVIAMGASRPFFNFPRRDFVTCKCRWAILSYRSFLKGPTCGMAEMLQYGAVNNARVGNVNTSCKYSVYGHSGKPASIRLVLSRNWNNLMNPKWDYVKYDEFQGTTFWSTHMTRHYSYTHTTLQCSMYNVLSAPGILYWSTMLRKYLVAVPVISLCLSWPSLC